MSRLVDSNVVLMLLGAALGVGVVVQLAIPNFVPTLSTAPPVMRSRSVVAQPFAQIPDFPNISLHPLFTPDRAQGGGGGGQDGPLSLVGLAAASGRASVVLRTADGTDHVLSAGETLTGWRLIGIGASSAELQRGSEAQILHVGASATSPTSQPIPQGPPGGHFH